MGLITDVRRELGESSAVFWSDQQIVDALNEAQVCLFAEYPHVMTTSTTLLIPSNVDFVTIPTSIMVPQYVLGTDGKQVNFSTKNDLENVSKSWWNVTTGKPKAFVIVQYNIIRVWPRADQAYSYTMVGIPWPTELTTSADTTTYPHFIELALTMYAASVLFTPTRPELGQVYYSFYADAINKQLVQMRRTFGVNTRRIRPAGRLGASQRGSQRQNPCGWRIL